MENQPLQLDLFLDSRSVMLANDAIEALVRWDAARAERIVAELRADAPDYPSLPALEVLTSAQTEWQQPTADLTQISLTATWLEHVVAPAAQVAAGSQAPLILGALFRELADAARGLSYDPAQPKAHRAWLSLRCGDWTEAEAAALTIPGGADSADVLHWLCVARHRQRGPAAARPALFRLAWHEPQRLAPVLAELGDEQLATDFRSFERACDWESVEPHELPAWFPAWYAIEHAPASDNDGYADPPPTAPARAAQLLVHIIELERQADWRRLIELREQLRALNSDLFSVYMIHRAVHYAR